MLSITSVLCSPHSTCRLDCLPDQSLQARGLTKLEDYKEGQNPEQGPWVRMLFSQRQESNRCLDLGKWKEKIEQNRVTQRSGIEEDWYTPGSQLEEIGETPNLSYCDTSDSEKADSFNFCPWSTENSVQPGHRALEFHALMRQLIVGSEGGKKEVEIGEWSGLGGGTKGTRGRGETQGVLALSAPYSWSISKQQSFCSILPDSLNVSVCSCQVVLINYSVTQLYHVPKKGRGTTELNRIKTQEELFDFTKAHVLCKESAAFSLETPSGERKGKVSQQDCWIRANTVEQPVSTEPAVCSESLWGKSGTLRMLHPVYCTLHRTWTKADLVWRLAVASDITHTALSNSFALHLSQFLHLWNRAW